MGVLPYQLIKGKGYITPEVEKTIAYGMSYGLSACGYDVRAAKTIWLWPLWGRLNVTIERFDMPNDVVALVRDKSTWARRFVFVQNTVIEPGWNGYLTLELTRFLPWPVKIKAGMPIAQIMFEELVEPTEKPYGKNGKYQGQPPVPVAAIAEGSPSIGKQHLDYLRDSRRNHFQDMVWAFALFTIVVGSIAILT